MAVWNVLEGLGVPERLRILESLKVFAKVRKVDLQAPYIGGGIERELSCPKFEEKCPPLDVGNKAPSGAINDALRAPKR